MACMANHNDDGDVLVVVVFPALLMMSFRHLFLNWYATCLKSFWMNWNDWKNFFLILRLCPSLRPSLRPNLRPNLLLFPLFLPPFPQKRNISKCVFLYYLSLIWFLQVLFRENCRIFCFFRKNSKIFNLYYSPSFVTLPFPDTGIASPKYVGFSFHKQTSTSLFRARISRKSRRR